MSSAQEPNCYDPVLRQHEPPSIKFGQKIPHLAKRKKGESGRRDVKRGMWTDRLPKCVDDPIVPAVFDELHETHFVVNRSDSEANTFLPRTMRQVRPSVPGRFCQNEFHDINRSFF